MHFDPLERPDHSNCKISKIQDGGGRHFEKSENVVVMNIVNSLLKTSNKTANINVKKLQFIHTVNGDASKTAKIIRRQR